MNRKEFLSLLAAGSASRALAQNVAAPKAAAPAVPPGPSVPNSPKAKPTPAIKLPPIQPGHAYLQAGPMLGHVGPEQARVWIRATAPVKWSVRVSEAASMENAREIAGPALADENACTATAIIDGLKAATRYFYEVLVEGRPQTVAPLPSFITAPLAALKGRQRIAFGSCVGTTVAAPASAWAELAERRELDAAEGGFDVFLMLGDNHYANTTEPAKLRTHYTAHRLTAGWRDLSARTPIYAIWDDHDFGPNNSDGTQKGKEHSLAVFKEFWANPAAGEPENPGCYFTFSRGDVQFFMMDGRYHRSPDNAPDDANKTMFGTAQLAWLKKELLASKATFKILANGSEWQTFGSDDSYSLYRTERDPFLKWIDEQKIEGIVFLSGDRHFSSVYQILGRFVELSSGPLGSVNARLRHNPERISGYDEGSLWMVFDVDTTGSEPSFAYELWLAGGGLLERRSFSWAQLHGREPIALSPKPLQPPRWLPKAPVV